MDLAAVLEQVAAALGRAGIAHALIGGVALAAHGVQRATVDVDFLVDGARADELHELMTDLGYRSIHRGEHAANYVSDHLERGRVDFLFAHRAYARRMLERARPARAAGRTRIMVVDVEDLIGLKVQASSSDPARRLGDTADIERLLRSARGIDLTRVREYFRIFEREKELDVLLAGGQPP
jgi:hypothetical protein